ncbi:hypothetical protein [Aeromonas hydrophila]|uniref:hypothetical protein n=1 Tax=Aeromonas hydrophila TaxID=644 RepID=UPI003D1D29B6
MEYKDILIEQMKTDDEFKSKRNQLTIISILLMAMSLSDAQIKEANTFIFKIEFSNTHAFGWLVLLGVMVLTVRYYSVAFKYHRQLFKMWADELIKDRRVLTYHYDQDETKLYIPSGMLTKINEEALSMPLTHEEYEENIINMEYRFNGIFKRIVCYRINIGDYFERVIVDLNKYDDLWTKHDFHEILKVEFEYRFDAIFRRTEHLDILLPYMLSLLAISSFIFKSQILNFL